MRKEKELSVETLRKLLRYDPDTGHLFWLPRPVEMFASKADHKRWTTKYEGKRGFYGVAKVGYYSSKIWDGHLYAHRVIWALVHGEWPNGQIDHIDGDKLNNRIENLRLVDNGENRLNLALRRGSSAPYHGVYFIKETGKWLARINLKGVRHHLGMFATAEEAIAARKVAEVNLGFHPNHGREIRRPA